jgi:UPF0716 protein FxsA
MNTLRFILPALLLIPFIELYLLIEIGSVFGFFPTVFMIIFTAVLGVYLFRRQGFSTIKRFQETVNAGQVPAYEMIEGVILLIGGIFLIAPGFFTDLIGFIFLIPQLRKAIARYVIEHYLVASAVNAPFSQPPQPQKSIIEGEFKKEQ